MSLPWKPKSKWLFRTASEQISTPADHLLWEIPMGTDWCCQAIPSTAWHCQGSSRLCPIPAPNTFFPPGTDICHTDQTAEAKHRGREMKSGKKKTTQAVVLTSSSWEGQVEKANFVLLVDSIYNPPFSVESALKWYCCAVLARDCTCWPLRGQHSTRMILYKRFALNVMKQMTKSINLEWCGYHKNDVNSEFMLVMKLFRFIIKASTISFFRIKLPLDNHSWMLQEIFNKCIQN